MAWIESHQALEKHPKVLQLSREIGWDLDQTLGKLHRFWWWSLDYAPDGRVGKWGNEVIANVFGVTTDATQFVHTLIKCEWLDFEPEIRIHDWWDYAGKFLQVRYKRKPKIWKEIKRFYGHSVYRNSTRTVPEQSATNNHKPNQPNLTNLTKPVVSARRQTLEDFVVTDELRGWARKKFSVEIPDDVVTEFKDYWRKEPDKKLRLDWTATFQSQIRKLVNWGTLKPEGKPTLSAVPKIPSDPIPKAYRDVPKKTGTFAPMPDNFLETIGKRMPSGEA